MYMSLLSFLITDICDQQGTIATDFSPSCSVFPIHCPSTNVPYSFIHHRSYIILAINSMIK